MRFALLALALAAGVAFGGGWEAIRATDFLDAEVVNNEGEALGEVHEVVIDMRTGRVHYAVLEVGGVLGLGEKLTTCAPRPWRMPPASSATVGRRGTTRSGTRRRCRASRNSFGCASW